MRPALFVAVVVFTVAPMGEAQKQSARDNQQTSVEQAIRKLDNERIQAQIHELHPWERSGGNTAFARGAGGLHRAGESGAFHRRFRGPA